MKDAGHAAAAPDAPTLTIADVADACGLPQPVIAQVVPRTWTSQGWMYTEAQMQQAIEIASAWPPPGGPAASPALSHGPATGSRDHLK